MLFLYDVMERMGTEGQVNVSCGSVTVMSNVLCPRCLGLPV